MVREIAPGSKIHVCKRSCGWLPLFQAQKGLWESVAEIKKQYNAVCPKIVNEYGDELTWEDFEKNVINWNGGYDRASSKTPHGRDYDSVFKDSEGYEFTWSEFS